MNVPPSPNPLSSAWSGALLRTWRRRGTPWHALWALPLAFSSFAQGPAFTYQGRVQESGTNFSGTGQFKFALVTTSGPLFTTFWSNDGSSSAGSEPASSVPITVTAGLFAVGIGDASLPNMLPVPSPVFTQANLRLRIWFSDGVSAFAALDPPQPLNSAPYSILAQETSNLLGSLPAGQLTGPLPPAALTGVYPSALVLTNPTNSFAGVGSGLAALNASNFTSGTLVDARLSGNVALLNANQAFGGSDIITGVLIATNPANRVAGSLAGSGAALTSLNGAAFMPGSIGSSQFASNSIGPNQLGPGAALANLLAGGQSAVPRDGMILSSNANDGNLAAAGYVKLGRLDIGDDLWDHLDTGSAPSPRSLHTAVWTGTEMIIWGGIFESGGIPQYLDDGALYNPAANSWTPITYFGPPLGRAGHTAVWTGTEMIVYGGYDDSSYPDDGGFYNPSADQWTRFSGPLGYGRAGHTALWTGTEMILWGGYNDTASLPGGSFLNDGLRYSPASNLWAFVQTTNAPSPRHAHTAVWTGSEMIIWGGYDFSGGIDSFLNDGGRYNPATGSWLSVAPDGAPTGRYEHTAVWTGTDMIVWGGYGDIGLVTDSGRYDPAADTWTAVNGIGAPAPRARHTAAWTGSEMIVWGGFESSGNSNEGGRYDPSSDTWSAVSTSGAPSVRQGQSAVWTGEEMVIWGGDNVDYLGDGGRYNPASDTWSATRSSASTAPSPRYGSTAVWTGSEMIIWGGFRTAALNDGARFNPAANSWTPVPLAGAPSARSSHTAVWSGTEMIVWGGGSSTALNDGGRYNPVANAWTPLTTSGAPSGRTDHIAVWAGSQMIVWGGDGIVGSVVVFFVDGGRYNPATDTWTRLPTNGAPAGRFAESAIWTGNEMIVWGGGYGNPTSGYIFRNDGGRYNPAADSWTPVSVPIAPLGPQGREYHSAVWTGSEMIIWGGDFRDTNDFNTTSLNDGWRYNPADDTWRLVRTAGSPATRSAHSAVWTGREMIIWGGFQANGGVSVTLLSDGGRYQPAADSWTPVSSVGAPPARYSHAALWTGGQMLVWGGLGNSVGYVTDTYGYTPTRDLYVYLKP